MKFFDLSKPTYIENWPNAVKSLSFADVDVPLTLEEARALGTNIQELGQGFIPLTQEQKDQNDRAIQWIHKKMRDGLSENPFNEPQVDFVEIDWKPYDISSIVERLDAAVKKFPDGAFVRLGSRSPKDAFVETFKVHTGAEAVNVLTACSERICDDLHLALDNNYAPHIFVRQWITIPHWQEFRCFMRNRRMIGISQYNYFNAFPELQNEQTLSSIRFGIDQFFLQIREACHLDDVVFDVWVKMLKVGNQTGIEVKLIEINPFFELTDPCLFDWHNMDQFDGSFKIKK